MKALDEDCAESRRGREDAAELRERRERGALWRGEDEGEGTFGNQVCGSARAGVPAKAADSS